MGSISKTPEYAFDNIVDALKAAATTNEGVIYYAPNDISSPAAAETLSYKELLHTAESNSARLQKHGLAKPGDIVLIHFESSLDSIVWYWSVLLAGAIPVSTAPGMFSQNPADRQKHLLHLYTTLNAPMCFTRRGLLAPFKEQTGDKKIETLVVEDFEFLTDDKPTTPKPSPSDIAAIMLTSGSSGNAKAVPLSHGQMLAAFKGKTAAANLKFPKSPFLSWVAMDHVANLVHCNIFAIVSGVSQIQCSPADVLVDPAQLLNLVSRHRVSRTFAPNFLFAKLRRSLEAGKTQTLDADLNLETLFLDTGGEANVVEVCTALQAQLEKYGAQKDVFVPSFGMTETCAGCIYNLKCPTYDRQNGLEFASLGEPMPGVNMRIARADGSEAVPGERGFLELSGDVLFKGYFNNAEATAEAFTADGWFRTGDNGYIDESDHLHLEGRTKEMININGVKYLPTELDSALEQAEIPGTTPSYYCTFGIREAGKDTETVVVLYLPDFEEDDDESRFEAQATIVRVVSMYTHSRPLVVALRKEDMPKSTLGKLSRAKLQKALESGAFAAQQASNDAAVKRFREQTRGEPQTHEEKVCLEIIREQLDIPAEDDFAVNDSVLSTGATSMDLVGIVHHVNTKLQLTKEIRLTDVLNNPTAKGLADRIATTSGAKKHEYDPVVVLQPHGNKKPIWLVHPGVGEVLVFVNMAHHITDRPVYAFRAKGFNAELGETPFNDLDEVFTTYKAAMKKRQPEGPYAIAGYSFGGMVAFEIAKRLEAEGDEVRYVGSWNLPPHIKWRMRELVWDECVMHLFYFVQLFTEEEVYKHKPALCQFEKEGRRLDAIKYLHKHADQARWDELALSEEYYLLWVGLASNMQGMACEYDPSGSVKCMDIMVADPLTHVAKNRTEWIQNRLMAWNDFVREDVKFHHVVGQHYTMLAPENVISFADTLRRVLKERGM
ncbi:acetyl-CoA synthetase-like protein [Xylariaceae sp. FL0016]|nr:acetyl-CoA synthetase-like protein [Xylariaceae sp. FL0016]